ncbi:sugar phosphorylase [Albirhodobacter sp. R86504]|uniref:sugar phosphorylase n=1 Tax=Albirhodobacter sp. R86504 TaxID=3093848 RepID=UPI00366FDB1F
MTNPVVQAPDPVSFPKKLRDGVGLYMASLYPEADQEALVERVLRAFWPQPHTPRGRARALDRPPWDQRSAYVITYGNTIEDGTHKPLDLLRDFAQTHLKGTFTGLHILPYFPFTSDDGFAVTDYLSVNSALGDWPDVERIAEQFTLMSDLVLNHGSSGSQWFADYLQGHEPYDKFYFEADPSDDLSMVVRPRAHDLLRRVETAKGVKHLWCTFSHDQVDFDFSNPEVLLAFIEILRAHIDHGVRTLRLDAVAFLWKEPGTTSIHLRQTHEIVRLFRLLSDFSKEPLTLITETNVPNAENLSYFGNRNEAHVVYNFPLPPLILHALLFGTARYLKAWQMSMPPAQSGCCYFNFTASHDGIGLRPAEGLIPDEQLATMIETVQGFGGRVSLRSLPDGSRKPYELNVALFDALKGTVEGEDAHQLARFICSQAIALGMEGIPGIYIHSLLATPNDVEGVERMGYNRAINRARLDYPTLQKELADPSNARAIVLNTLKHFMNVRAKQPAFHPDATQFTLQLDDGLFGIWRQSTDRSQSIFAISNLTAAPVTLPTLSLNLIEGRNWVDLLTGEPVPAGIGDIALAPYQTRWISNLGVT